MRRFTLSVIVILSLLVSGCATVSLDKLRRQEVAPVWPEGADASAARFKKDLMTLASDAYEGREAGTPGFDKAVEYVTAAYRDIGLEPAGDNGTYLQQVALRRGYVMPDGASVTLSNGDDVMVFDLFEDFFPSPAREQAKVDVTAEVVFVGYGVDAPQFGETAYRNVDVQGKIVAILPGVPEGLPSEERAHFANANTKRQAALKYGAVGMISLNDFLPTEQIRGAIARQMSFPANIVDHPEGVMPRLDAVVSFSRTGVEKLFAASGIDADNVFAGTVPPQALGTQATIQTTTRFEDYQSPNVIGMIRGSDRRLRKEYVVLTAHLDHIGKLTSVEEGTDLINNGAMDNASGTATLLEEARKFMMERKRPRRSILFVALTAEEKGLLGSEYFAMSPTVPKDGIVANVNLDMPILLHEFTDVIAFGAEHSSLKETVETAAAGMGISVTPDPVPEMVLFVRSDHYNFVKAGVPSVFLFMGFAEGGEESFRKFMAGTYHRPGDDPSQEFLFDQAAKWAELNFRIAKEIANAEDRPTWNEGDFFGDTFASKE